MPFIPANRRAFLKGAGAIAAGAAFPARSQTGFPGRQLRIILPVGPGGAADVIARAFASVLERSLNQSVIVEYRPGGNLQISMQALQSAPADGHTLVWLYNGHAAIHVIQKLFDLQRQIDPIAQVMSTPITLLVRGDSPYRTMRDFIEFGRRNPGKLTYGTFGPGSVEHLKVAQIEHASGFTGTAVPYKGGGPDILKAVLSGEIDLGFLAGIFAKQFAPSGKVRVLAVLERERWSDFPDVPTIAEAGVDTQPMSYWGGFGLRAGTPPAIVQRLYREIAAASALPEVRDKVAAAGASVMLSPSVDAFRTGIASDIEWMSRTAKQLNF